jgi:hypothetical protein
MSIFIKLFRNKVIRFIVIPIILLVFWFFGATLFNAYGSLTTLEYSVNSQAIPNIPEGKFFKGSRIKGSFTATEDNLGILALKIKKRDLPFPPIEEDVLRFSLTDGNSIVYENRFRAGTIQEGGFLLIGFPKIPNSKGKTYTFQLLSENGVADNAIAFDKTQPMFYAKYIFSFREAINDKSIASLFLKKFHSVLLDRRALFYSFVFLLPFIYYVAFHLLNRRLKNWLESMVILFIFLDVIQVRYELYALTLSILGLWIMIIRKNNISYRYNIILSGSCLLIAVAAQVFGMTKIADKSSMWGYFLLVITVCQIFLMHKNDYTYKEAKTRVRKV